MANGPCDGIFISLDIWRHDRSLKLAAGLVWFRCKALAAYSWLVNTDYEKKSLQWTVSRSQLTVQPWKPNLFPLKTKGKFVIDWRLHFDWKAGCQNDNSRRWWWSCDCTDNFVFYFTCFNSMGFNTRPRKTSSPCCGDQIGCRFRNNCWIPSWTYSSSM